MTPFTPKQRAELHAALDRSQREARAESERLRAERKEKSAVVRAAEHARRASEAKQAAAEIFDTPKPPGDHCEICGAPAKGDLCLAHSDLEGKP